VAAALLGRLKWPGGALIPTAHAQRVCRIDFAYLEFFPLNMVKKNYSNKIRMSLSRKVNLNI
jgi:hypothetical protein